MKRFFCVLAALLTLAVAMSSCSYFEAKDRYKGGQLLDDELLADIREEIFSSRLYDEDLIESFGTESDLHLSESDTDAETADLVYWTDGGSVWHTYSNCGHLKNSNNAVHSGTRDEAREAGKTRLCSSCAKK